MTDEERDNKIIETHTDMKWVINWCAEHKALHDKYLYYFVSLAVGVVIGLFI